MNILLLIIGLSLSAFGVFTFKKNQKLAKNGVKTMAKVVDVSEQTDTDSEGFSSKSYYPVLEFVDQNSQKHKFKGNVGGGKRKYHLDQEVEIIYDPTNPAQAQMKSFFTQWIMPMIIVVVGIMLAIGGVVSN